MFFAKRSIETIRFRARATRTGLLSCTAAPFRTLVDIIGASVCIHRHSGGTSLCVDMNLGVKSRKALDEPEQSSFAGLIPDR